MESSGVTIQMKAIEQYFPVVLFIILYKVFLTYESVDGILSCDHSNESYIISNIVAAAVCFTLFFKSNFEKLTLKWDWPNKQQFKEKSGKVLLFLVFPLFSTKTHKNKSPMSIQRLMQAWLCRLKGDCVVYLSKPIIEPNQDHVNVSLKKKKKQNNKLKFYLRSATKLVGKGNLIFW